MPFRFILSLLLATGLAAKALSAQEAPTRLKAQVTDSLGVAIPLAEVIVMGTTFRATADSEGVVLFTGLPSGLQLIQVRAIGWRGIYFTLRLEPGQHWVGRIGLEPVGTPLPDIVVQGRRGVVQKPGRYAGTEKYDDFFRRKKFGFGTFRTREDIDRASPMRTVDLLQGIPSVTVTSDGAIFRRCSGPAARVGVWIDGWRVLESEVGEALQSISPRDIEMMEVYRSAAQLPGEFLIDSCAAIVIWTRWN
ncbi:MAG: TonB-dependent receptor plug domain-containing protein [Gemmatimonadales bacterium]|nr:TonB-dependent receptor plug domain-containing protein [Gemmatimonadales bacterium]